MTDDAQMYRSVARWESLPWWEREHINNFGRTTRGQFYPRFAGGDRCDRSGCPEKVEARGRRFCATHRQEHGQRLLTQLQAIRLIRRKLQDRGASAVEYGLLVAAVSAVIVGVVFALGSIVQGAFRHTCETIAASPAGGGGNCGAPVDAPPPVAP